MSTKSLWMVPEPSIPGEEYTKSLFVMPLPPEVKACEHLAAQAMMVGASGATAQEAMDAADSYIAGYPDGSDVGA
jgi:hypothetical protein